MQALDKDLRSALEKTVKAARTIAEIAANAAVDQLGVGHDKPDTFFSDAEKALRNRLRTHGKQLGDARDSKSTNPTYGKQAVQHLVQEVAYEHWHRMLFARFLADNDLLMYDGVAVTLEECDELAADEGAKSGWELAGKLAARMLPQVFKPGSPVFLLTFAPEHQSELERLLKDLADDVFKASDSLGWVYQFWQADNKERINKSEVKIGADELPAVTQLFTEPYMVAFLLHNSLGAWWVTRHPDTPCPVELTYLRTLEDGSPAAGKFEGWPDTLADFKLLDPCCGSGHFLVAAFLMLVPMRMAAEGLNAKEAVARVLADNLHGLELDPRCVEIAVFAVALEAWRYPDASGKPLGVREIPAPNIACCGLKVAAKAQDWEALVPDTRDSATELRAGLRQLHAAFAQAPLLGSLLDPRKSHKGDLFCADYDALKDILDEALGREFADTEADDAWDIALSAKGLLEAANILDDRYHLVITNVPYLARGRQNDQLANFILSRYEVAKTDLAAVFMLRGIELLDSGGVIAFVEPQNWLYQAYYKKFRKLILDKHSILLNASLGAGAFEEITGEVVKPALTIIRGGKRRAEENFLAMDTSSNQGAQEKAVALRNKELSVLNASSILQRKGHIISSEASCSGELLEDYVNYFNGICSGDYSHFGRQFWELPILDHDVWRFQQTTTSISKDFAGFSNVFYWQNGNGDYLKFVKERLGENRISSWIRGGEAWGKQGIAVSPTGMITFSRYSGQLFDDNTLVLIPKEDVELAPIWQYLISIDYNAEVRKIDKALKVRGALVKVDFDYDHWLSVVEEKNIIELPCPFSNDPTQWIFHGHPQPATDPLQVAVARLLGYTWPAETDSKMDLSDEARDWIARSQTLSPHADEDGIVCIPAVGQESSASDRLLNLLAAAYGDAWSNDTLAQLLTEADHAGKSLETWLREKFFTQHCKRFGNRPFIWHVWDGLRDGFAALVNYHKLDYKTLESLIYTYLGDWISRQKRDVANAVDGAQEKLAAAEVLKKRLELILEGETPYDIFVRWKPVEEQPIGWNPDLNDGVRMNIRPFLSVPDVGKRGAGILRDKPNIKWEKDRGADVASAPWFNLGTEYGGNMGDRINDHHLSLAEKRSAREKKGA